MRRLLLTGVAAGGLLMVVGTTTSQAQVQTGAVWEVSSGYIGGAAAHVPQTANLSGLGTPTATFIPNAINYDSNASAYTLGAFLNNPTFISGGSHAIDPINGDVFQFTGVIGLTAGPNSFVVGHDDGVWLSIAGIGPVVSGAIAGGPTSFDSTPFNVNAPSTGNYQFTLNYGECCGAPGVLEFAVNGEVVPAPEPASMAILGTGIAGLGWLRRRRKRPPA